MSEMDKLWMHSDRRSKAYEFGVEAFLNFAVENLLTTTHIRCPCVKCVNLKLFGVGIIRDHLYFMELTKAIRIGHFTENLGKQLLMLVEMLKKMMAIVGTVLCLKKLIWMIMILVILVPIRMSLPM